MAGQAGRESLKTSLRRSWITLGSTAVAVSLLAFLIVGFLDFKKTRERLEDDLRAKSLVIDRRISAEVLGSRKAVTENVIHDLVQWYDLKSLVAKSGPVPCKEVAFCIQSEGNLLTAFRRSTESVNGEGYIEIQVPVPTIFSALRWVYFIVVFLPIFGLLFVGIILQRRILNQSLIEPIESLVAKSYRGEESPESWPAEIAELSERLDRAFRERDQIMIGQLAGGVFHDIKTNLHSVGVATDLATEKLNTEKFSQRLEALYKVCFQQIPKMKAIIESVLDGSREIRIQQSIGELTTVISNSVASNQHLAGQHQVQVWIADSASLSASFDPVQLERAVTNLVKNAIEASAERADQRQIRIGLVQKDYAAVITVEDSGLGLKQSPNKIFESMRTTKTHGTGLGLLITRKIIEAHGGTISAENSSNLPGAKFTISIPSQMHEGENA